MLAGWLAVVVSAQGCQLWVLQPSKTGHSSYFLMVDAARPKSVENSTSCSPGCAAGAGGWQWAAPFKLVKNLLAHELHLT